jgi:hypothetical protein
VRGWDRRGGAANHLRGHVALCPRDLLLQGVLGVGPLGGQLLGVGLEPEDVLLGALDQRQTLSPRVPLPW